MSVYTAACALGNVLGGLFNNLMGFRNMATMMVVSVVVEATREVVRTVVGFVVWIVDGLVALRICNLSISYRSNSNVDG